MQIIKADFKEEQKPQNLNKFVYINRVGRYIYGKSQGNYVPKMGLSPAVCDLDFTFFVVENAKGNYCEDM